MVAGVRMIFLWLTLIQYHQNNPLYWYTLNTATTKRVDEETAQSLSYSGTAQRGGAGDLYPSPHFYEK